MSARRERFEAWHFKQFNFMPWWHDGQYPDARDQTRWEIWQAGRADGVAETARRCHEIVRKWEYSGTYISDAIKAEFPEAFK